MTPPPTIRLDPQSVEQLARRIAELIETAKVGSEAPHEPSALPPKLLSAAEVSEWWGVDRSWVYENAEKLGAIRIGTGRRPRLRFDPAVVKSALEAREPR